MRLGSYPAGLQKGSVVAEAYGSTDITERHRHRYEVANAYHDRLTEAGLVFSSTSPDGPLVEFASCRARTRTPSTWALQAHPELKSRPTRPHPLFRAFVQGAVDTRSPPGCRWTEDADEGRHLMWPAHDSRRGDYRVVDRSTVFEGPVISLSATG